MQNIAFSELVVKCQGLIRQFAYEQLRKLGVDENDANLRASSCVSQRDIQVYDEYPYQCPLSFLLLHAVEGFYILLLDNQNL